VSRGVRLALVAVSLALQPALASAGGDAFSSEAAKVPSLAPDIAPLPTGTSQAEDSLRLIAQRREAHEREWRQRQRACYLRFLVNPCLEALRVDRLAAVRQFDALEFAARQALREAAATERNRREADRLANDRRQPAYPTAGPGPGPGTNPAASDPQSSVGPRVD
jgi:hypothetical protein